MYAIMAWSFPVWYFSECYSDQFQILDSLFLYYLSIRSFCYILFIPIFYSQIVLFPLHLVVGISPNLLVEFSFVISECLILFLLLDPVSVTFKSPFFRNIFWFFFSSYLVRLVSSFILVFSFQYIPVIFSLSYHLRLLQFLYPSL